MLQHGTQLMPKPLHLLLFLELELILGLVLILPALRHPNETVGIINFPYPCRAPFIVWSNIVNNIVNELISNITAPAFAFGNNKFSIGCANTHIPIVHGSPINIDINKENLVFSLIVL